MFSDDRSPATEATIRIEPPCSAIHARQASCTRPRLETTLVSRILRNASRSRSTIGPYTGFTPTLPTSMSRLPKVSTAVRTAAARCPASAVGPATATAPSGPPRDSTRAGTPPLGPAEGLDRRGQRLGLARRQHDPGAPVDQALRDRQPDAPAAAGH